MPSPAKNALIPTNASVWASSPESPDRSACPTAAPGVVVGRRPVAEVAAQLSEQRLDLGGQALIAGGVDQPLLGQLTSDFVIIESDLGELQQPPGADRACGQLGKDALKRSPCARGVARVEMPLGGPHPSQVQRVNRVRGGQPSCVLEERGGRLGRTATSGLVSGLLEQHRSSMVGCFSAERQVMGVFLARWREGGCQPPVQCSSNGWGRAQVDG